nr:pyrophosphate--fructose 6-phosphate 1-phosphotransferase subunit alpha [Tanacetum cinerariifolium]
GTPVRVEFGDATAAADPTGANVIARSFPHTYEGLFAQETLDMIDDVLATYKNQGGYDLLG